MMINTMKTAMIIASDAGARTAGIIREELGKEVDLFSVSERSGCVRIDSITDFTLRHFGVTKLLFLSGRWEFVYGRSLLV